jgi:phosphoglycerate dehydrogenase-like enzyme
VLANVGRGPLVDEDALYDALAGHRIGGAVLDVWWHYPRGGAVGAPSSRPFGQLDTVVLSPHSSGVTRQTFLGRARDVAENVRRLERGQPLLNPVRAPGRAAAAEGTGAVSP